MLHGRRPAVTIIGIVVSASNDNPKEFALMDVDDARADKPGRYVFYLPAMEASPAGYSNHPVNSWLFMKGRMARHISTK